MEILPAVQAGPQNEMAIEQSPGLAEKGEKIFAHDFVGRFCETLFINLASDTDALQLRVTIVDPTRKCRKRFVRLIRHSPQRQ